MAAVSGGELMPAIVSDKQIIEVIKKHPEENLTVRRLCKLLGYQSTSTMHNRLRSMEERGLIKVRVVRQTVIDVLREVR